MAPFPASSVVDKRQVPICLRLKGETANDEFAELSLNGDFDLDLDMQLPPARTWRLLTI